MRGLAVLALLAGCKLYWTGNGDDVVCNAAEAPPGEELRNPQTGMCQTFQTGGGCGPCEPCGIDEVAIPNWPQCFGACDSLQETDCLVANDCHAAYDDLGTATSFIACWDTETAFGTRPTVTQDDCTMQPAEICVFRTDCISVYLAGQFEKCLAEPALVCATACGVGTHCESSCANNACQAICAPDDLCAATTCETGHTCVESCNPNGDCTVTCKP
jgi:hypothetical protein